MNKLKNIILILTICFSVSCEQYNGEVENYSQNVIYDYEALYFDGEKNGLFTGNLLYDDLFKAALDDSYSLRDKAILTNIKSLIDYRKDGLFYNSPAAELFSQKKSGYEYTSVLQLENGIKFTSSLFVPSDFDHDNPCLILGASSGSRGVYGAIGVVGLWAATKKCALVLTDKGTGTGFWLKDFDVTYGARFEKIDKNEPNSLISPAELDDLNEAQNIYIKQVNDKRGVEKYWGDIAIKSTLHAIDKLNYHFKDKNYSKKDLLIIGAGISNGGATIMKAADKNHHDLFDGFVVSEPNIFAQINDDVFINHGERVTKYANKQLLSLSAELALYETCAVLSNAAINAAGSSLLGNFHPIYKRWCALLAENELLSAENESELPEKAYEKIQSLGFEKETDELININVMINLWPTIMVAYANSHLSVGNDMLCQTNYDFVNQFGINVPFTEKDIEDLAALSSGVPPVNNKIGIKYPISADPILTLFNVMKCFHDEVNNEKNKSKLEKFHSALALEAKNINTPLIMVSGQGDRLISASNHARAAYFDIMNNSANSNLVRYYEVEKTQHFDSFLPIFPDLAMKIWPLHHYFEYSLDLMYDHLLHGRELPVSQIVENQNPDNINVKAGEILSNTEAKEKDNIIMVVENNILIPE